MQDNESQILNISSAIGNCNINLDNFANLSKQEMFDRLVIHKHKLEDSACEILKNAVAIESQRKYFKQIFFESPLPCIIIDQSGRICLSNKSFSQLLGTNYQNSNIYIHNITDSYARILNLFFTGRSVDKSVIRADLKSTDGQLEVDFICSIINTGDHEFLCCQLNPAPVLSNLNLLQELQYDLLTGLYSRQYFSKALEQIDQPDNLPITAVSINVDGIKIINDLYGFLYGDRVIRQVAEVVQQQTRNSDFCFRMGGDDILILMPSTVQLTAENIVENINQKVKSIKIQNRSVTVSVGISCKCTSGQDIRGVVRKAEDNMFCRKIFHSNSLRSSALDILIRSLYEKNRSVQVHSHKVASICRKFGQLLNLNEHELSYIERIGALHDIGKIGISESTINKQSSLSVKEWEEIRSHPEMGYRILRCVDGMESIAENIYCHHERYDGTGYPRGLKGNQIPLYARIVTISDSYDAMSSDRTYRNALSREQIINEFQINAGKQFDPQLAHLFIEKFLKNNVKL